MLRRIWKAIPKKEYEELKAKGKIVKEELTSEKTYTYYKCVGFEPELNSGYYSTRRFFTGR